MKRMDTLPRVALALIAFVALTTQLELPAHAASFEGKWRAVVEVRNGVRKSIPKAVKMVVDFVSGGAFRQTVKMGRHTSPPEVGEWKIKGGKLIVKSGPSKGRRTTKVFGYRVKRGRLQLTMQMGKEKVVLHLRRP
jgi:hypothetical protein